MSARYGIIGFPLSHSFSPAWFTKKFRTLGVDASYDAFPLERMEDLTPLIKNTPDLRGLSVTIPYKEQVHPWLNAIHPDAEAVGAVNCIDIRGGKLTGYNTDIIGFRHSLEPLLQPGPVQALILGSGGAARAVAHVLKALGIPFHIVTRRPDSRNAAHIPYSALSAEMVSNHRLIINTTPLGMYPLVDACPPIPYEGADPGHIFYDLVYNPAETRFLTEGKNRGAVTKNGLEMLELQAEAAWEIWSRK
jgi:shikimate dehydrogenase